MSRIETSLRIMLVEYNRKKIVFLEENFKFRNKFQTILSIIHPHPVYGNWKFTVHVFHSSTQKHSEICGNRLQGAGVGKERKACSHCMQNFRFCVCIAPVCWAKPQDRSRHGVKVSVQPDSCCINRSSSPGVWNSLPPRALDIPRF